MAHRARPILGTLDGRARQGSGPEQPEATQHHILRPQNSLAGTEPQELSQLALRTAPSCCRPGGDLLSSALVL